MIAASPWFFRPRPSIDPDIRLFCFPFAGGSAAAYRLWASDLPAGVEMIAVQMPGRANRLDEKPIAVLDEMVDKIISVMSPLLDRPFAFFGHSMGSVIAAEVSCKLQASSMPIPRHLFVSARHPPDFPHSEPLLHVLPDAAFLAEIDRRYGGIPPAVAQYPEIMELLLPALRADITALETMPSRSFPQLDCPITAYGGVADRKVPASHLEAWRDKTTASFRMRLFAGGHFYLDTVRPALLADLGSSIEPHLRMCETSG